MKLGHEDYYIHAQCLSVLMGMHTTRMMREWLSRWVQYHINRGYLPVRMEEEDGFEGWHDGTLKGTGCLVVAEYKARLERLFYSPSVMSGEGHVGCSR